MRAGVKPTPHPDWINLLSAAALSCYKKAPNYYKLLIKAIRPIPMPSKIQQEIPLDATPSKRIYLSIISDYDLPTAICELVDNVLDAGKTTSDGRKLRIEIDIDLEQQTLAIRDNAGGVSGQELRKLISPGETTSDGFDGAIGNFGVGSKRAVVALAEDIRITTRHGAGDTFRLEYDDEWLTADDWHLPYFKFESIEENTTRIELARLRNRIDEEDIRKLRVELSVVYANFIKDGIADLIIQDMPLEPRFFDQWAFPPDCPPVSFRKTIFDARLQKSVRFNCTSGLTYEGGSLAGDFGVFVYCNRRLVTRALRTAEVGFIAGLAGQGHHEKSLARVIVELDGPANLMPWTSNKTGIFYNHRIFKVIQEDIITAVKHSTKASKILKADFDSRVAPFKNGEIISKDLGSSEHLKISRLPKFEAMSRRETIDSLNKLLGVQEPWTKGLYETMIAERLIASRKVLTQKNRISLILLDSTVEIGCKEYLNKKLGVPLHVVKKLKRFEVHRDVEAEVLTGDVIWERFKEYYHFRNAFVHESTGLNIPDAKIDQVRLDVQRFLNSAFGIRFP